MANVEDFDILILGSGGGGKLLAWTLGSEGKRVVIFTFATTRGAAPTW
jgi:choline dehydrogenase-like flavoprotein